MFFFQRSFYKYVYAQLGDDLLPYFRLNFLHCTRHSVPILKARKFVQESRFFKKRSTIIYLEETLAISVVAKRLFSKFELVLLFEIRRYLIAAF